MNNGILLERVRVTAADTPSNYHDVGRVLHYHLFIFWIIHKKYTDPSGFICIRYMNAEP